MHFINSISTSKPDLIKKKCLPGCDFKSVDNSIIPIVAVAPPTQLKGVIVSRDPTTDFIDV